MPFTIGILVLMAVGLLAVKAHGFGAVRMLRLGEGALPANYRLYTGVVTPDMTAWASAIVTNSKIPFGSAVVRSFGKKNLAARVEHHLWTMRDGVKVFGYFRGVTLYEVG